MSSESESEGEDVFDSTCVLVETMLNEVDILEARLKNLRTPIKELHLDQLGDLEGLKNSPFRTMEFKFKTAEVAQLAGLDSKKRHTFKEISHKLRITLLKQGVVNSDGLIVLTKPLQKMFETKETVLSYPGLLGCLRSVLV